MNIINLVLETDYHMYNIKIFCLYFEEKLNYNLVLILCLGEFNGPNN